MNVNGGLLENDVVLEDEHRALFAIKFFIRLKEVQSPKVECFRPTEMFNIISV